MKSRVGQRQREEKRLEERRVEERVRRKKMQMREKVGKSRKTMFFQWFEAPESRKVGSLKRRVRSQLARWEMKNCTPLWREAHFQVKMYKTHHSRTIFGSWDVEKVHAVVARSTFPSEHVKNTRVRTTFGRWDVVPRGRCKGLSILSKVSKMWGFCSNSKNDGRHGTFEEDLQRCIFRSRRSTKDMFMRDVGRSGRSFPQRGCILEHQICRFAKMILRDRCSTAYDLASIFRGRRSTLERWSRKIAKRIGTRLSALHSTFHFWRKSRKIVLFLMLSSSKIAEVTQNCFVLDVVKCKKMKKSCRIVSFWMLLRSKIKEVSQNCLVFKLADRQTDRQTERERGR